MIKMLRIDDRLIHGQVAVTWSKSLAVDRIIVVSDSISQNEMQKSALKMAAPEGVKAFIFPVDKAAALLNDPRSAKMKVLLVMNNPVEVAELLNSLKEVPEFLDIANYGRVAGLDTRKKITDTVYLDDNEVNIFKQLSKAGKPFVYQPLPNDQPKKLDNLLEG